MLLGLLFGLAGMGSSSAAIVLPIMGPDLGVTTQRRGLDDQPLRADARGHHRGLRPVSDLVGVRIPLLVGLMLMTVGALLAALAPTFGVLLGARLLQGAGAAAVSDARCRGARARYTGSVRGLAFGRLAGTAAAISCRGRWPAGVVEGLVGWRGVMALPSSASWSSRSSGVRCPTRAPAPASTSSAPCWSPAPPAGMVLLVQSPSTGLVVAAAGVAAAVLGVPAVVCGYAAARTASCRSA